MDKKADIIAIIPARGGSRGIPRKNLAQLNGRPLIYYTIIEAGKSNYLDRIFVSTDDGEIAAVAREYRAEVIERPVELGRDDTPSFLVYQHVIRYVEEHEGLHPGIIVILQPTSPLRIREDIDGALDQFLESDHDTVVSVCAAEHPPHWMYTLDGDKMKLLIPSGDRVLRRQDAPAVYRVNGAVYVIRRDVIMKEGRILGTDTRAYIMPPERSVDIDNELDLKLAGLLMKEG